MAGGPSRTRAHLPTLTSGGGRLTQIADDLLIAKNALLAQIRGLVGGDFQGDVATALGLVGEALDAGVNRIASDLTTIGGGVQKASVAVGDTDQGGAPGVTSVTDMLTGSVPGGLRS